MRVAQWKNIPNVLLKDAQRQHRHWREEKVVATDGERVVHRLQSINITNSTNNSRQTIAIVNKSSIFCFSYERYKITV